MVSVAFASALFEASLFGGISIRTGSKPLSFGWVRTGGIFSILHGSVPKILVRVCSAERCLLTLLFTLFLTGSCKGCSGGRVAIRVIASWQAFSMVGARGRSEA